MGDGAISEGSSDARRVEVVVVGGGGGWQVYGPPVGSTPYMGGGLLFTAAICRALRAAFQRVFPVWTAVVPNTPLAPTALTSASPSQATQPRLDAGVLVGQ